MYPRVRLPSTRARKHPWRRDFREFCRWAPFSTSCGEKGRLVGVPTSAPAKTRALRALARRGRAASTPAAEERISCSREPTRPSACAGYRGRVPPPSRTGLGHLPPPSEPAGIRFEHHEHAVSCRSPRWTDALRRERGRRRGDPARPRGKAIRRPPPPPCLGGRVPTSPEHSMGEFPMKLLETETRASAGHARNQSMVHPFTSPGNLRARSGNLLAGWGGGKGEEAMVDGGSVGGE